VLSRFGLFEGINEVVLSTVREGVPNAAPMGVHIREGRCSLRVYEGSQTHANLQCTPYCVAHVSYDPMLFVRSALSELSEDEFGWHEVEGVALPVLLGCEAYVAFRCAPLTATNTISTFELLPVDGKVLSPIPRAHNRGFAALIEACVLATRYVLFEDPKMLDDIVRMRALAVKCGDASVKEAFELLLELLPVRE